MKLIADSGSTKTDWVLTGGEGHSLRYKTVGYNPYFVTADEIFDSLRKDLPVSAEDLQEVNFYGAGCSNQHNNAVVATALQRFFPKARIMVGHDMLGAARALLADRSGFAAIIGTGSNTCLYNGVDIEKNIDSLGYLLGDEGSGSYIGKKMLRDYLRGYLPASLSGKFADSYKLNAEEIFEALYHKPAPNRYLASFCRFADVNRDHPYVQKTLEESFTHFFEHQVSHYPGYQDLTFNCVGSVGFVFRDQLKQVADAYRMQIGKVIASPIDDLVNYHHRLA